MAYDMNSVAVGDLCSFVHISAAIFSEASILSVPFKLAHVNPCFGLLKYPHVQLV